MKECEPIVLMNCSLPLNNKIFGMEQVYCPPRKCPLSCQRFIYNQRISYISYPVLNSDKANTFKVFYKQRYNKTVDDRFLKDNLVSLQIFFNKIVMTKKTELKRYDFSRLVSDIGGQLGLWLGFSIITLIDIMTKTVGMVANGSRWEQEDSKKNIL